MGRSLWWKHSLPHIQFTSIWLLRRHKLHRWLLMLILMRNDWLGGRHSDRCVRKEDVCTLSLEWIPFSRLPSKVRRMTCKGIQLNLKKEIKWREGGQWGKSLTPSCCFFYAFMFIWKSYFIFNVSWHTWKQCEF